MSESLSESMSLSEEVQSTSSLHSSPVNESVTLRAEVSGQSQSIEDAEKQTSPPSGE